MNPNKLSYKIGPLLLVFSAGLVAAIYESIPEKNYEKIIQSASASHLVEKSRSMTQLEYRLSELDNDTQNLKVKRDKEVEGSPAFIDLDKNIWDTERRIQSLRQELNAMKRIGASPTVKEVQLFESEISELKETIADLARD